MKKDIFEQAAELKSLPLACHKPGGNLANESDIIGAQNLITDVARFALIGNRLIELGLLDSRSYQKQLGSIVSYCQRRASDNLSMLIE